MQKKFFIFILVAFFAQNCFAQEDFDLGQINVLASRTSLAVSDISKGISVIAREDIEKSTATSLPEIIGSQSGIFVSDYLGNPKGVNIDIRGFGETSKTNVLVLVDGRRTNQVDLSGADWSQINLDSVERIEILKGAATVLYGDNASAGVINIVTRKGYQSSQAPLRVGTEFGSYQYKKGFLSTGGSFGFFDYYFNYSYEETSGYRANNDYWANDYLGNVSFYPTDKFSLDFSTGYHRDRYGMPGALFASDIETAGRRGTTHTDDKGWTSDYFVNIDPKFDFLINENEAQISLFSSYRKRDNKSLSVSSWGRYETLHQIDSFEIRPKLETKSNINDRVINNFTVGFDYFYAKDKIRSGNQSSAPDFVNITKQTFGLYVLENAEFDDKYLVSFGARTSWAEYIFDQRAVSVNKESKSLNDGALNFGLGYKYNEDSQIYFDYSRSFRFPVTDEYYQNVYTGFWGSGGGLNTSLKHQVAQNYEIGVRDISFPWLKADANFFFMDVKNEIYYDPITYKNSNYSPATRHYGFELSGKAQLFKDLLEPYINWTSQDAFFHGGSYSGNKVPFVPKNKINTGISIKPFKNFMTTFSMNYVDKCYAISDQSNAQAKLNSYVTFDVKVDYTYKNINFWFGVKNIFDRRYNAYGVYSSGSDKIGFYPAEERNFVGGVSFEF